MQKSPALLMALCLVLAPAGSARTAQHGAPVPVIKAQESQYLSDWVKRIAGRNAISCGARSFPDRETGRPCAAEAMSGSKAFWIAYEDIGLDHGGWHGFARNAKGQAWMVVHDFGSGMRNMERPRRVIVTTCKRLFLERDLVQCERL